MTEARYFAWHDNARLHAAGRRIERPLPKQADSFCSIPSQPLVQALSILGSAVQNMQPFCLFDGLEYRNMAAPEGAFLTLTGGSSGSPKAILRQQHSWTSSFRQNADIFDYAATDAIAVLGGLGHSLALYGILEALHCGLDAHALAGIPASQQRKHIADAGITILYLTPTQLRILAKSPGNDRLPAVRLILCGGGALDAATRKQGQALCSQADILEFYGAAETSFITLANARTPQGSVGKAYPGVTLSIRDQNGNPTQGTGEVWVKSPYLFDRYMFGDSPETRWQDGAVTVGELGQIDDDDNLWLRGRKRRMVTIADQNVFPEEVEAHINAISGITNCAVVPHPDKLRGHRLTAVISHDETADMPQKVRRSCQKAFGPLIAPKSVLVHPALPLLASGKPDLLTLAAWVKERI